MIIMVVMFLSKYLLRIFLMCVTIFDTQTYESYLYLFIDAGCIFRVNKVRTIRKTWNVFVICDGNGQFGRRSS